MAVIRKKRSTVEELGDIQYYQKMYFYVFNYSLRGFNRQMPTEALPEKEDAISQMKCVQQANHLYEE